MILFTFKKSEFKKVKSFTSSKILMNHQIFINFFYLLIDHYWMFIKIDKPIDKRFWVGIIGMPTQLVSIRLGRYVIIITINVIIINIGCKYSHPLYGGVKITSDLSECDTYLGYWKLRLFPDQYRPN